MRRGRRGEAPVSFFSFQDVLLCLIGIAIVIAMTLILQVAEVTARAVEAATDGSAADVPRDEQERNLRDRIAVLTAAVREAESRPSEDPLAQRSSLRLELLAKAGELKDLEARAAELERQLRELLSDEPGAAKLSDYLALVQARDERLDRLGALEQRKQIAFIIDEAEPLRPIIMEVSGSRIVVTDTRDGSPVRMSASSADEQCRHALQLFDILNAEYPSYIVLVVTPNGTAMYLRLLDAIEGRPPEQRPRIGLDLIPEGCSVSTAFPAAARGTP